MAFLACLNDKKKEEIAPIRTGKRAFPSLVLKVLQQFLPLRCTRIPMRSCAVIIFNALISQISLLPLQKLHFKIPPLLPPFNAASFQREFSQSPVLGEGLKNSLKKPGAGGGEFFQFRRRCANMHLTCIVRSKKPLVIFSPFFRGKSAARTYVQKMMCP